jgi:single-strand DNA-binding protein
MATRSWNRVELIGNLTRDPELRYTPTGSAVVTFSIATNRTYVVDGEKKEDVDFHRIVAWNKLAELCSQLLKKGNRVFVSGRLQNRSWEGQDGVQKQTTEIVIEDMIILTSRNFEGGGDFNEGVSAQKFQPPAKPVTEKEEAPKAAPAEETEKPAEEPAAPAPANEEVSDDDIPF